MAVEHRHQATTLRHIGQQSLDMASGARKPILPGALGGCPAGMQPIRRGDREQADIAPVLADQSYRRQRLGRHGAGIGDDDLGIRARSPHPIGAVDDVARTLRRQLPLRLCDAAGREPQIDRAATFVPQTRQGVWRGIRRALI